MTQITADEPVSHVLDSGTDRCGNACLHGKTRLNKSCRVDDNASSVDGTSVSTSTVGGNTAGTGRKDDLQSRLADAERALEHKSQQSTVTL